RSLAPGSLEDFGQDEHRHVAPDAIALAGDFQELAFHRLLSGQVGVVKLQRILPAGKVRIAAVGKNEIATFALDPDEVCWAASQIFFGDLYEILGMIFDPWVIKSRVIGGKIKHQADAAPS